jgi:hypothetical protein
LELGPALQQADTLLSVIWDIFLFSLSFSSLCVALLEADPSKLFMFFPELGASLLQIERSLKSDEWSFIFWAKGKERRAMSELSKKRVRWSLKAIAQFKRALRQTAFWAVRSWATEGEKSGHCPLYNPLLETGYMAH